MIMDSRLEFGDANSVAAAASTISLLNAVDQGTVSRDLGNGEEIFLVVTVDTDIVGATAGTIQYRLVSAAADRTAPTAFTSPVVHAASQAFTTGTTGSSANKTKAGDIAWVVALPQGADYLRYLGVEAIIAGQTLTAGKVNAFLTKDKTMWKAYADAVN